MKQIKAYFKGNVFLKIYLGIFLLLNLIYVFIEVYKSNYIQKNSLEGIIEKANFEYLSTISKITVTLEFLIILICLVYIIKIVMQKSKINIKYFSIINFIFFTSLIIFSCLVSLVFSAPFGNLIQQLYAPIGITMMFIIYYTVNMIYQKIYSDFVSTKS